MQYFFSENSSEELFVLFHGTGGNEFSLLFLTGELNPQASVISFLGNHMTGENRRYFPLPIDDQLDLAAFHEAVNNFLIEWDRLSLDYPQITFVGYSNGANLLQGILQKRPSIVKRAILLHPQEFHFDFSSSKKVASQLLITTGANDTLAIPGEIMALSKRLKHQFSDVDLMITDGEHGVLDEELIKIREWYQEKINI